jgi:hypothetical protein
MKKIQTARQRARARGAKTYRGGLPCRHHGAVFRYVATDRCCKCAREDYKRANRHRTPVVEVAKQARTKARKAALQSGARYYRGSPCVRGHDGQRFASDGSCVQCKETHYQRLSRAQKDRQLKRQRHYDQRAAKALRVLEQLGIAL